ncbi:hypothetical protein JCM3766R1_002151 [Sporobolomyces carnicolor]
MAAKPLCIPTSGATILQQGQVENPHQVEARRGGRRPRAEPPTPPPPPVPPKDKKFLPLRRPQPLKLETTLVQRGASPGRHHGRTLGSPSRRRSDSGTACSRDDPVNESESTPMSPMSIREAKAVPFFGRSYPATTVSLKRAP